MQIAGCTQSWSQFEEKRAATAWSDSRSSPVVQYMHRTTCVGTNSRQLSMALSIYLSLSPSFSLAGSVCILCISVCLSLNLCMSLSEFEKPCWSALRDNFTILASTRLYHSTKSPLGWHPAMPPVPRTTCVQTASRQLSLCLWLCLSVSLAVTLSGYLSICVWCLNLCFFPP